MHDWSATLMVTRLNFKGRAKDNCSWRRQGDGNTSNDLVKLKSAAEDAPGTFVGMHGTILKDVCKYLNEFDADGNGKIDSDEFVIVLQAAGTKFNLFTGSEDPNFLNDLQVENLLLFDKWLKSTPA